MTPDPPPADADADLNVWRCRDCDAEFLELEIEHDTCPVCGGKPRRTGETAAGRPTLADALLAVARVAAERAARAADGTPRWPDSKAADDARTWAQACREALEARRIADEPLDDGERAAAAQAMASLRRSLGQAIGAQSAAERQRDRLAEFMRRMAGEFESAGSDQAKRQARRLRTAIDDVYMQQDALGGGDDGT